MNNYEWAKKFFTGLFLCIVAIWLTVAVWEVSSAVEAWKRCAEAKK